MVSQPKLSQGRGSLYPTVGKIVAVRALSFNRIHCVSNTSAQLIQQQSLGNSKIQQISISLGIWFGTRVSEVQILSPRPICSGPTRRHGLQNVPAT